MLPIANLATDVMDEAFNTFIPPLLRNLGYESIPCIQALGRLGSEVREGFVGVREKWAPWHGILEYLSFVELARVRLKTLPTGKAIGGLHLLSARYESVALVFFAQATLDQIAAWLTHDMKLKVAGRNRQLHKKEFRSALSVSGFQRAAGIAASLDQYAGYLSELEQFRQTWIHSLAGGAAGFTDRAPDQGGILEIAVPIDPTIALVPHAKYYEQVQKCREQNGGRWLYPIGEFADRFAEGTKLVTLSILDSATS